MPKAVEIGVPPSIGRNSDRPYHQADPATPLLLGLFETRDGVGNVTFVVDVEHSSDLPAALPGDMNCVSTFPHREIYL